MLKRLKTVEERETFLLELIESDFRKAKLMQLVKETCGLTEQHLEAIMTELNATVLTRGMFCSIDDVFAVAYRLHTNLTLTDMCLLNCRGSTQWQSVHYRATLRHLVALARSHNELRGFAPRFFERHSTQTVQRLVASNADHYGWLTNCVVVDCTDELIEV